MTRSQAELTAPAADSDAELRAETLRQAVEDLIEQIAFYENLCDLAVELAPVKAALELITTK